MHAYICAACVHVDMYMDIILCVFMCMNTMCRSFYVYMFVHMYVRINIYQCMCLCVFNYLINAINNVQRENVYKYFTFTSIFSNQIVK